MPTNNPLAQKLVHELMIGPATSEDAANKMLEDLAVFALGELESDIPSIVRTLEIIMGTRFADKWLTLLNAFVESGLATAEGR